MQQYHIKVLPGENSENIISMLHDLACEHQIEISPISKAPALSDSQVSKMIAEADHTAHYMFNEAY